MPYSIKKDYVRMDHPEGGTFQNVHQDWLNLLQDPNLSKRINCLIDLRSLPKPMESVDVLNIARNFEILKEKIGPKLSFVVKTQVDFGMVRMFGSLVEMRGYKINVFESEEEAISWLQE